MEKKQQKTYANFAYIYMAQDAPSPYRNGKGTPMPVYIHDKRRHPPQSSSEHHFEIS